MLPNSGSAIAQDYRARIRDRVSSERPPQGNSSIERKDGSRAMRNLSRMTLSLLLTAAFAGLAAAQTTDAVQGTVKDQQGPAAAESAQAPPADTAAGKSEEKKEEP